MVAAKVALVVPATILTVLHLAAAAALAVTPGTAEMVKVNLKVEPMALAAAALAAKGVVA